MSARATFTVGSEHGLVVVTVQKADDPPWTVRADPVEAELMARQLADAAREARR